MARLIDEGFEGTGYEEPWTEGLGAGCTLNEDSALPAALPGGGSECLKVITLAGIISNAAFQVKSNNSKNFVRAYIYIAVNGYGANNSYYIVGLFNSSGQIVAGFTLTSTGLIFKYFSGGGLNSSSTVSVSLNTWYLVEFKYDEVSLVWEWRLDGVTQQSGVLTATTRVGNRLYLGNAGGMAPVTDTTIYLDNVAWDDFEYPGPVFDPGSANNAYRRRRLLRMALARNSGNRR